MEWPIEVDIDKRKPESKLSPIRDGAFHDISVYTKGRVLVEGTEESRIERVSFRNILLRMTGYENIQKVKKLNRGTTQDVKGLADYGPTPRSMIFAFTKGLLLEGIATEWPAREGSARPPIAQPSSATISRTYSSPTSRAAHHCLGRAPFAS